MHKADKTWALNKASPLNAQPPENYFCVKKYFIHSALRLDHDHPPPLCLPAEVFVIQKLSFGTENFRNLTISQPLTMFTPCNNSLFFLCQRRMLMTIMGVLICATIAYKTTEQRYKSGLHKFQQGYSGWSGTVILEHDQEASRTQQKKALMQAMNAWGKQITEI